MPISPGPLVTPDDVLDFLQKRHPKVLRAIIAAERERITREVGELDASWGVVVRADVLAIVNREATDD